MARSRREKAAVLDGFAEGCRARLQKFLSGHHVTIMALAKRHNILTAHSANQLRSKAAGEHTRSPSP